MRSRTIKIPPQRPVSYGAAVALEEEWGHPLIGRLVVQPPAPLVC